MIDATRLRTSFDESKKLLQDRVSSSTLDAWKKIDETYRKHKTKLDDVLREKNILDAQAKNNPDARVKSAALKETIQALQIKVDSTEQESKNLLASFPNFPSEQTPRGTSEKNNVVVKEVGKAKSFAFTPRTYLETQESETFFQLEQAREISGARFAYMTGRVAELEFALVHYALNILLKEGFTLVFPPTLVRTETMKAMGYLDQAGEQEIFHMRDDDLVLVGTAEQSLGPLHMKTTIPAADLPKRYVAFTPCYRREAGSYGKDTKGILRLHQFEKIEMFSFVKPDQSNTEHLFFLDLQERLVKGLGLHYRVVDLCAGDLGHPSSRTFDIESFLPGQNNGKGEYRETHSTSNCTDFQSRQLGIKFADGKHKGFIHTVNGTAFALQRIIIAIIEQYQTKEKTFEIPEALKPFMITKS